MSVSHAEKVVNMSGNEPWPSSARDRPRGYRRENWAVRLVKWIVFSLGGLLLIPISVFTLIIITTATLSALNLTLPALKSAYLTTAAFFNWH